MGECECEGSVRRRIAESWGFYFPRVELLECTYADGWCTSATFRVNGIDYSTDFSALTMLPGPLCAGR